MPKDTSIINSINTNSTAKMYTRTIHGGRAVFFRCSTWPSARIWASCRNRARRRLREIVRRRWERVPQTGYLMMFVAYRSAVTALHQDLATDVERVLVAAGALAPLESGV